MSVVCEAFLVGCLSYVVLFSCLGCHIVDDVYVCIWEFLLSEYSPN